MLPDAAAAHYAEQRGITAEVLGIAADMWGSRPPSDFDTWFDRNLPMLMQLVASGQGRAMAGSGVYVADVLDELGIGVQPDAVPNLDGLIGVASDGRALESLMYGAVITAKGQVAQGASTAQAWASGLSALLVRMQVQVADASRAATSLHIASRRRVGYVRMLNPPSCPRCTVLAGKFYKYNVGFLRHPGCDCRHIPSTENRSGDLTTDPNEYFESLSVEQQDRQFTVAGAQAIRDGADISQVVNARRGMSTAQVFGEELLATHEGVTRRGVAYRAMSNAGSARRSTDVRGRRYFQARPPRLMPESIMAMAEDRPDALRLLKLYGYMADEVPMRSKPVPLTGAGGGKPPVKPPTRGQSIQGGDPPRKGNVDRTQVKHVEQHELDTAERLALLGHNVTFRPPIAARREDVLIEGPDGAVAWEFKSPTSSSRNTIMRQITKSMGEQANRWILDINRSDISFEAAEELSSNLIGRYADVHEIWIIGAAGADGLPLQRRIGGSDG
ncbi:hypothetical protein QM716_10315 [Rhodococcus sp. IEGM 1409]|uniref:CdiA C-terminal domain-containing protein n=1 Tax=Rhodococcus sp. IEGM 1409 TaxID=3047082 RepID=UPI0024B706D8|nr:hypothetical protein [Rhodococcus sp. IEGM 1409]MDI9900248.1 hypothetical protein [Rhodococcus sp. IEGM 1409]